MAKLPTVAIIGRPNTGKSTLFNRLAGMRKAIVSEIPGTTRDMVSHRIDGENATYMLLDTGGIGTTHDVDFEKDVARQSTIALEHADVIIFTVSGREELTSDDLTVQKLLRTKGKRRVPVIVALTKIDDPTTADETLMNYHELTIGKEVVAVSAVHKFGIEELVEAIEKELAALGYAKIIEKTEDEHVPQVAIIGRPNVGKSSMINALMSDNQRETTPLLVSDVAGTTRDSTDTAVRYHDKPYVLIDTAGLRKRSKQTGEIEYFSMLRTLTSIDRADVVILVLSATDPVSQQDKRIASMAVESGKGLIIIINKIDQVKGEARKAKINEVTVLLGFCKFATILPCSAVTREGVTKIFDMVESVQLSRVRRIPTRDLRRWFEQCIHGQPLGEVGRIKHLTQAKDVPPTFVLFVKNPKRVGVSQLRYLENRMRETFGFQGTPIRWKTKISERKGVKTYE
jgi:GTP-binding protein